LAFSVTVVSLYAVIQNLTGFEIWKQSHLVHVFGRYPALGLFDNQQTWAGFAIVAALYLSSLALEETRQRLIFTWASLCALFGAVASQVRGTLVGFASGLIIWATLPKRRRMVLVAAGCVVAALTISPGTLIRFNELRGRSLNPDVDISRIYIWKTAWAIGRARPLLGAGPGNFEAAYQAAKDRPDARTMTHAHNEWFNEWATSGLPGVATFTWLLFVVARALWRRRAHGALPAFVAWVGLAAASLLQCHFSDELVVMLAVFLAAFGLRPGVESAETSSVGKAA
jgi:O-antigen ligase